MGKKDSEEKATCYDNAERANKARYHLHQIDESTLNGFERTDLNEAKRHLKNLEDTQSDKASTFDE